MAGASAKLVEIAGGALCPEHVGERSAKFDSLGPLGNEIYDLLKIKNGFLCFESALHFFSYSSHNGTFGIFEWNSEHLWKPDYSGLANDIFCFAEDIFARQFVVFKGKVGVFEPETADVTLIGDTIEDWASKVLLDYNQLTGYQIARKWQLHYGALQVSDRLMPKKPFVVGGSYAIENLVALNSLRIMKNLGNLAHQIKHLPDGAKITFNIK